jgi:hypothetical protein
VDLYHRVDETIVYATLTEERGDLADLPELLLDALAEEP